MTKVSVIIPAYNAHQWIENAIRSVPKEWEVIVVDDCSPDGNYDYLKDKWENVVLTKTDKNGGAGVARNKGMELATGEWIIFLDADDELLKDFYHFLDNDLGDAVIFAGQVYHIAYDTAYFWTFMQDIFHGKAFRKDFLEKYHLKWNPQLRLYEDVYFTTIAKYYAKNKIFHTNEVVYQQNYNLKSTTKSIEIVDGNWLVETVGDNFKMELYKEMQIPVCELFTNIEILEDRYSKCVEKENATIWRDAYYRFRDYTKPIIPKYKLSILIPLYKSKDKIQNTLDKLYTALGENIKDCEILCSVDSDDEIYDLDYPNLTIYYNTIRGYMGKNRNRILRLAQGEFVYFLDHDDELLKSGLDHFFEIDKTDYDMIRFGEQDRKENILGHIYTSNYCVHGKFFRTNYLRKNNILYSDKIKTSEDVYFYNYVRHTSPKEYDEHMTPCSVWERYDTSTCGSMVNDRTYEENHFYEEIRAWLLASKVNGYFDSKWFYDEMKDGIYYWINNVNDWYHNSKNFNKSNLKVMAALYIMWLNFYDEDLFENEYHLYLLDEPWVKIIRAMIFKLNGEQKRELQNLLVGDLI